MASKTEDYYSCNKTSLRKILKDCDHKEEYLLNLKNYCSEMHHLAYLASHIFKLYILGNPNIAPIGPETYEAILHLLNKGDNWNPRSNVMKTWKSRLSLATEFYCLAEAYQHPQLMYMQCAFQHLSTSLFTNLKVNVQEHFVQMLLRYCNFRFRLKDKKKVVSREEFKRFNSRLAQFKSMILNLTSEKDLELTDLEKGVYTEIGPLLEGHSRDRPIAEQVATNAMNFFAAYCQLSKLYESNEFRQFAAIPLRRSLVQSHVPLDTEILSRHIFKIKGHITLEQDQIWSKMFKTSSKVFKPRRNGGLCFAHRIATDGIAVSVYLKSPIAPPIWMKPKRKSKEEKKKTPARIYPAPLG